MTAAAATLQSQLRAASVVLAAAGIDSAYTDAEFLAAHVLGVPWSDMVRQRVMGTELTRDQAGSLAALVEQRAERIPLQHLTGLAHFRRLSYQVGPGVFVPRPETEVTVGLALAACLAVARAVPSDQPAPVVRLVDLCAGSGVIAISVVTEAATAGVTMTAVAVEVSPEAALWARRNTVRLGHGRVEVRREGVAGCCDDLDGRVDVVTANPPYIPDGAVPRDPEVRDHDPALALFGGPDGLDVVRQVVDAAARLCRPGGTVVIEHGEDQGPAVRQLVTGGGFEQPVTHPDLTGRPRATVATRRS